MGAWGPHALDSDQALDWLANEITDPAGQKIRRMIDRFNKLVDDQGDEAELAADKWGMELRAAAHVLLVLNYYNEREFGDLHGDMADVLQKISDSDWLDEWTNPDEVRKSIGEQIERLRMGPHGTTLFMEND